jgi:hypothetical protein
LDVERELDKLRDLAWGSTALSTASAKKTARAARSKQAQSVKITVPQKTLEAADHLILDLGVGGAGPVYKATDHLRVDLPRRRAGNKRRFRITLDVESEEDK